MTSRRSTAKAQYSSVLSVVGFERQPTGICAGRPTSIGRIALEQGHESYPSRCAKRFCETALGEGGDGRRQTSARAGSGKVLKSMPREAAEAACQPDFDTPGLEQNRGLLLTCKRCFRCAPVATLRAKPCKAKSEDMSNERWQVLVHGRSGMAVSRKKDLPLAKKRMRAVRLTEQYQEGFQDYHQRLKADPEKWRAKNERERLRAEDPKVKRRRRGEAVARRCQTEKENGRLETACRRAKALTMGAAAPRR